MYEGLEIFLMKEQKQKEKRKKTMSSSSSERNKRTIKYVKNNSNKMCK